MNGSSALTISGSVCASGVERLPLNLALKNMVEKLEAAQKGKALVSILQMCVYVYMHLSIMI